MLKLKIVRGKFSLIYYNATDCNYNATTSDKTVETIPSIL